MSIGSSSAQEAIVSRMLGWRKHDLSSELEQHKSTFLVSGVRGGDYSKRSIFGAMYKAFMTLENMVLLSACEGDAATFSARLRELVYVYFLDLRISEITLRRAGREDFVRSKTGLLNALNIAIVVGMRAEVERFRVLLGRDTRRSVFGNGATSSSVEAISSFSCGLFVEGRPLATYPLPSEIGCYRLLVELLCSNPFDSQRLDRFVAWRQEAAARAYVTDDGDGELAGFCQGSALAALLPIEIVSLTFLARDEAVVFSDPLAQMTGSAASGDERQFVPDTTYQEIESFVATMEAN